MFLPSSSSLELPSSPVEQAASSCLPDSVQEAPARKAGSMHAIRRRLKRLSGQPVAKHAEHQQQRDSTQDSCNAALSPDHSRKGGSVQQNTSGQPAQLRNSASPVEVSPSKADSRCTGSRPGYASQVAPVSSPREPATGTFSTEEHTRSRRSEEKPVGDRRPERVRRGAGGQMHPMLAAIQHLADDIERGGGQAALQKLAAIRSICQAGLSGVPCQITMVDSASDVHGDVVGRPEPLLPLDWQSQYDHACHCDACADAVRARMIRPGVVTLSYAGRRRSGAAQQSVHSSASNQLHLGGLCGRWL